MSSSPILVNLNNLDVQDVETRKLDFSICEFSDNADDRLIKLAYVRSTKEDRYSPIHRHNFDQVRYIFSGEIEYGPLKCGPGDCVYFPEGVFYGPTQVKTDKAENYTIQSQGPNWSYLLSRAEAKKTTAELTREAGCVPPDHRRISDIDSTTVQEADLLQASDPAVLDGEAARGPGGNHT